MVKYYENIDLRPMNTFGFEVRARKLIEFESADDLKEIFADAQLREQQWDVLAGGSNIIFCGDYRGTLLHPTGSRITLLSDNSRTVRVGAGAGTKWDDFVGWCVDNDLWGAENLSYIPGMVGSSPVQNIGAYGAEAKDIIESVEMYCVETDSMLTLAAEYCDFGYRDSVFKKSLRGKVVITNVNFVLSRVPRPNICYGDLRQAVEDLGGPTPGNIREAVTSIRKSKLPEPSELGNAGSFFKNPLVSQALAQRLKERYPSMPVYPTLQDGLVKLAAGWLIDQSGWKGRRAGNVGVHEHQALVLVNYGGGTGDEILSLAAMVQRDVKMKFGVDIDMEVNIF